VLLVLALGLGVIPADAQTIKIATWWT